MSISPQLVKGSLIQIDARTGQVQRVIALQYNPGTLSRSLQVKGTGGEGGDHLEAQRLTGPPVETIKLEIEIDAADQFESTEKSDEIAEYGIGLQLAALERIVYPASQQLLSNNSEASSGTLEIAPAETPLTLFVWSAYRVLPVRITEFSVTEEAFDPKLNPLRAKVSLGMRVLSVNDLGFDHPGGNLFMTYHQQLERLAEM
jgi:hypothetical protein